MKKKYIILVFTLVFTALPVVVQAQEDKTNPERLEREKRISQRISQVKPDLSDEQKNKYKTVCKGAQTKVSTRLETAKKFSENQDKKAEEIINGVSKLIDKLKSSGQDVSSIEQAAKKASQDTAELKAAYGKYTVALSDAVELDCQVNPAGFRASIDDAKQQFKILQEARREVKQTIQQDIKSALAELKK